MRFVDLAIAALIGISSIAGLVAFSPRQGDDASNSLAVETQLRDELVSVLQQKGIVWFMQSSPTASCEYLRGLSNSSVSFSGAIGPYSCGPPPPPGVPLAELNVTLTPYQVSLEAWAAASG